MSVHSPLARWFGCSAWLCALAPALADGPALKRIFPAGAGRNQTVEVSTQGEAPKWPVQVWCDDEHVHWEPLTDKGKFRVTVDGQARLGLHHIRFSDENNSTDALRFLVGPIPEINETEPNDDAKEAFKIAKLPVLINGVLEKRGSVDTFEIQLEENQTLVASVEANANLRSPVDATVQVLSSTGTVLAQNLDRLGLDPLVEFQASRSGHYLVRVFGFPETPDSTIGYAGGDNFVYRLTLTTGGWVRTAKPLAFDRKQATKFQLAGVQLPQAEWTGQVPDKFSGAAWPLYAEGLSQAMMLDVIDLPQSIEAIRPESGEVPRLAIPSSMTGNLSQFNERDFYTFEAKKDTKLSIALTSRRLGLPMDGVLRVLDLSGKQVAREDDTAKEEDARLIFQPPADGNYVLEVTDAFMAGGADWVYRIDIQPLEGDAGLTVKADHFTCKVNEEMEIPIAIERRNGFNKPLVFSLEGAPAGVKCEPVKADKDAKEVKLKLTATAAARGPFRIVATQEGSADWKRIVASSSDPLLVDLWLTALSP